MRLPRCLLPVGWIPEKILVLPPVPVAASLDIVLQRLQAREEPVAQDPSTIESAEDDEDEPEVRVKAPGMPGPAKSAAD